MTEQELFRKKTRASKPRHVKEAPEKTPYEVLEVAESASPEEIRKAYLSKLRISPPERDPDGFKRIKKAYSSIEDHVKRRMLDLSIFKKESGIDLDPQNEPDFSRLFIEEIFRLMLSSSDFYITSFDPRDFTDIEEKIRKLQ